MRLRILAALALAGALPALAATDWQPVAAANGDRVELDKSRIARVGEGRSVAWTRLIPGRELKDGEGTYTAVQALNRYDCAGQRFATLKRVYLRGSQVLREEKVASPKEMSAEAGSADQKLLAEVCKPRSFQEARQVAEEANKLAAEAQSGKPGVMYADMRTAADEAAKAKAVTVADAAKPAEKAEKPAEKPAEKAAEKAAEKPAGERPRFITLPKIDKSQLEEANKPVAKPGETKPAEAKAAKPGETKAAEAKAAKPAEQAAAKAAEAQRLSTSARHELERQYATSGPRRAPARRKAETAEAAPIESHLVHWSYEGEGAPANWGKLRPDYVTCAAGKRQSPIDIREGIRVDLEPITFEYHPSLVRITDNGHTVQVTVGEGSSITLTGRSYRLLQFHFHRPAEEKVNGKSYDMVIHLVHQDDEGHLAVVAVLLEKGAENPLIQSLWNNMPLEVDQPVEPPSLRVDPTELLPRQQTYYTYMGSLTTPPCTEGVLWLVMKQPMQVSAEQIAIFSRLYRNNARPIQPANGRLIKESRQ